MRKIPNNGNPKMMKVAYPLGLFVCLFICIAYVKWHWVSTTQAFFRITEAASGDHRSHQTRNLLGMTTHGHRVFNGIMFDAGSTGTQVHIFQFTWQPGGTPNLTHETFKLLQPGLSAYADDIEKVKEVFKASPFLVGHDCVSIMNRTDEAPQVIQMLFCDSLVSISAWITINFLTGHASDLPRTPFRPPGCLTSLQIFNRTYKLYSDSYLGLGLMSAQLVILGGAEGKPVNLHQLCAHRVLEVLENKVHSTEKVKDVEFYVFSYYYDLAANVGLIDAEKGCSLVVGDFEISANYGLSHGHWVSMTLQQEKVLSRIPGKAVVCQTAVTQSQNNPFMCMDLTYISLLLQEFGFPRNKVLKLTQKINNVETSWALGAIFHYIDSLNGQKSRPCSS